MLTINVDELPSLSDTELGVTGYRTLEQERIDQFAVAADDDQWIHTDPIRAATGPFGTTVAHGFLTLALVIPFFSELLEVQDAAMKVNYGLDRVRFTSPVVAGSRLRMRSRVDSVSEVAGGFQIKTENTIEIDGQERPALVAEFISRFYR